MCRRKQEAELALLFAGKEEALILHHAPAARARALVTVMSAIVGGGQLPLWLGWVVCLVLQEFVGLSLAELSSAFPTSAGSHYATYRLAPQGCRRFAAYLTGWVVLVGNLTITLSVTFGFASLLAACITIAKPEFAATNWQLLLIFYAILVATFAICLLGNRFLPFVDSFCAGYTLLVIFLVLIVLPSTADERHSASYTLGHFDSTLSGWGGFGFAIGLLPSAYCFSALGMVCGRVTCIADEFLY